MFPFRYSSIFRSRWIALLWAAGVLWMASDMAHKPAHPANSDANSARADTSK